MLDFIIQVNSQYDIALVCYQNYKSLNPLKLDTYDSFH